jgi:AcrR family transcriptional regulator
MGSDEVNMNAQAGERGRKRLSREERRLQLLDTARSIVRDEGADQLTLGRLAVRAGVSKPVAYDHFETRSALLIDLYRWLDTELVDAFGRALAASGAGRDETIEVLANAYIHCASDTEGEIHAVGAALAGSEEKAVVFQELMDNCVQMFLKVLEPHCQVPRPKLERRCVGLVGAGEGLSAAKVRGNLSEAEAVDAFIPLIRGALG